MSIHFYKYVYNNYFTCYQFIIKLLSINLLVFIYLLHGSHGDVNIQAVVTLFYKLPTLKHFVFQAKSYQILLSVYSAKCFPTIYL